METGCSSLTCGLHGSVGRISARWSPFAGALPASVVDASGSLMRAGRRSRSERGVEVPRRLQLRAPSARESIHTRLETLRSPPCACPLTGTARWSSDRRVHPGR